MPISIPTLKELLAAGAHFGQKTSRWHPKVKPFLFGSNKGVHIINLERTREHLAAAAEFALNLSRRGGTILFIGTKRQSRAAVEAAAKKAGMPYVTGRWMGGLFTNFNTMLDLLRKLERLEGDKAAGKFEQYTKREQLDVEREIERLHGTIGGIKDVRRLPDAVFIVDATVDKIAIGESTRKGIPIIAIVDSNANPEPIAYPIPANDDAVKSVELISNVLADAILEGKRLTPTPSEVAGAAAARASAVPGPTSALGGTPAAAPEAQAA